jgi:hypothetical protein
MPLYGDRPRVCRPIRTQRNAAGDGERRCKIYKSAWTSETGVEEE